MLLSSLLESGVDGVGTEATDDLFFGALGDVEFLVALICVDCLVGALDDFGFMVVLSAKFLRAGSFFLLLAIFLVVPWCQPPPVNLNQDVSESQHQLLFLCC